MRWMMPVEEILQLRTYDGTPEETVADVLPDKELHSFHLAVAEEMRLAGVNLVPVVVWNDMLYDGHHRILIAVNLGHEEMLVTDNIYEADDWELVKYKGQAA